MNRPQTHSAQSDPWQDAEALHAAVSRLVRIYQFRDREKICCYDISVTQCDALEALVERGPARSLELAEVLMLDKSTTTRVVDALVRKGYAERLPDPGDARAVCLRVTPEGRQLYVQINNELIQQQSELLRDLPPEIRAGATELIRRLARAAQARFVSSSSPGSCASGCGTGSAGSCD